MKLGIMQPYFFPYLGYFSLIKNTDKWIVFDEVQYIRHGWVNRNRVLKPGEGWQYVKIPLKKHSRDTLIKDIEVSDNQDWQEKIIRQLEHYKKRSPYYNAVINVLNNCFSCKEKKISKLNAVFLENICKYLDIDFQYQIFSEMKLEIEPVNDAGEWALNISKAIQATEYINPPGGKEIFDSDKFHKAGIKLNFLDINLKEYDQKRKDFEPGLSIIDVMMFNSPEEINEFLNDYKLI